MPKKLKRFLLGLLNMAAVSAGAAAVAFLCERILPATGAKLSAAVVLILLYLAGSRWIERRAPAELRLAGFPGGIGGGAVLGAALFSSVMAMLWLLGAYHPSGWGAAGLLPAALVSALAGAAMEETIFRGFLFRLIAAWGGNWTALALTSALFGLAHIGNRGATLASSAAIAIEAGVLLGAAYAAAGSLWLPVGIHAGWNFAEGPLFGTAVSGHAQHTSLIIGELRGPVLLTGGTFGPEASLAAIVVCLALAAVYLRRMAAGNTPAVS
ncbi:MAG TPA: CPBP family intramembrane glutamic endopeptidase [Candidatus Acidoferrales bacterium]|nr:CPBP family intramembrane glutamic endopeptidase [Candidatus Acidoferrales bacterium]